LKQRDDVGERLVKRQHVGIGRFLVARMQTVEQGMCRFMRHDVMRHGAEHVRVRQSRSGVTAGGIEIAEQQGHPVAAIEGVLLAQRMRPQRAAFQSRAPPLA
jgi:hypothetical protein